MLIEGIPEKNISNACVILPFRDVIASADVLSEVVQLSI